jgi:hypothetical protein
MVSILASSLWAIEGVQILLVGKYAAAGSVVL